VSLREHRLAAGLAVEEYQKYRVIQDRDYISDFEKATKNITASSKHKKKEK